MEASIFCISYFICFYFSMFVNELTKIHKSTSDPHCEIRQLTSRNLWCVMDGLYNIPSSCPFKICKVIFLVPKVYNPFFSLAKLGGRSSRFMLGSCNNRLSISSISSPWLACMHPNGLVLLLFLHHPLLLLFSQRLLLLLPYVWPLPPPHLYA